MARNWQAMVDVLPDVGKLVHLAMRQDSYDVDRLRGELVRQRRRYYETELTAQAQRIGCKGQVGRLSNGAILSEMNDQSKEEAAGIINTYNADLAAAIRYIRAEIPTANRYTYAKRLGEWEQNRAAWKNNQIQQYTETSARSKAQRDFYQNNNAFGYAELVPKKAVCPVCQGWIERGQVPVNVAISHPPPYHPNCCPPDTMIVLPDGLEKRIDQIGAEEVVASRQGTTRVVQVFQRHTGEALYRIFVDGQELRLTGDHPVLTERGWIPARELQVGDVVVLVRYHE